MSQLDKLEGLLRKIIREEIAEAIPIIVESLQPTGGLLPQNPNVGARTESLPSVRDLLERHVGWEDGPPGNPMSHRLPVQAQAGRVPSHGLLAPERGVDGGPVPPLNEINKPVYEAINTDYSAIMKKLNLV